MRRGSRKREIEESNTGYNNQFPFSSFPPLFAISQHPPPPLLSHLRLGGYIAIMTRFLFLFYRFILADRARQLTTLKKQERYASAFFSLTLCSLGNVE